MVMIVVKQNELNKEVEIIMIRRIRTKIMKGEKRKKKLLMPKWELFFLQIWMKP